MVSNREVNAVCYNRGMNDNVWKQVQELKDGLKSDPRILRLYELEKKVNDNQEIKSLFSSLKEKENAFAHANHFDKEEMAKANRQLHEAKLALDSLPLAKKYNAAYIEVRDLYMVIDDILFGEYRKKLPHIKE